MANANRPFGLRPHQSLNGSPYSGNVRKFAFTTSEANAVYVGDPVTLAGGQLAINPDDAPVPTITKGAINGVFCGVIVGFMPDPTNLSLGYRLASTARYALVDVDPNTVYEIQGNNATWDGADVGLNASLVLSTGSTATGTSNAVLNQSTAATTATLDVQILNSKPEVGNDISGAYPIILVKLNNHQFVDGTTGI